MVCREEEKKREEKRRDEKSRDDVDGRRKLLKMKEVLGSHTR